MKTKQEIVDRLKGIIRSLKERRDAYINACQLVGLNCYSGLALNIEKEIIELEFLLNDLEDL